MISENLVQWLKDPTLLNRDSMFQLKSLVEDYPCFAVARILYLKNLLVLSDLRFSKELVITALSVADRRRMYYFMEDKPLPRVAHSQENERSSGEGFSIIDRFLHLTTSNQQEEDGLVEEGIPVEAEGADNSQDEEVFLHLPEVENSFSLDYVRFMNQSSASDGNLEKPMAGQDLIDAFLQKPSESHSISSDLTSDTSKDSDCIENGKDLSDSILYLPEDTFTETLAKIYLKQNRYAQALEIFKSLSLKYPEKNVYFADQIRFLEKLINNIK